MTECEWCEQIWPVLVDVARNRQTITYKGLKARTGFNAWQRTLSHCLGRIANHCHLKGWPIITAVVVNQTTGMPGNGIPFVDDFEAEQSRVYDFLWQEQTAPVAEEFPESACLSS